MLKIAKIEVFVIFLKSQILSYLHDIQYNKQNTDFRD